MQTISLLGVIFSSIHIIIATVKLIWSILGIVLSNDLFQILQISVAILIIISSSICIYGCKKRKHGCLIFHIVICCINAFADITTVTLYSVILGPILPLIPAIIGYVLYIALEGIFSIVSFIFFVVLKEKHKNRN